MQIQAPNFFILVFHVLFISLCSLIFLRKGKETLVAWCVFLATIANLFVHKQITVFGLNITSSDAIAVGYLICTNLVQEFYGTDAAKKSIFASLAISTAFAILATFHLQYHPSTYDTTQTHFSAILSPLTRITAASVLSFFIVQFIDLKFFKFLREKTKSKFLASRLFLSSFLMHALDTLLFSFLGLYGSVHSVYEIIFFSLLMKMFVVFLNAPLMALSKRVFQRAVV